MTQSDDEKRSESPDDGLGEPGRSGVVPGAQQKKRKKKKRKKKKKKKKKKVIATSRDDAQPIALTKKRNYLPRPRTKAPPVLKTSKPPAPPRSAPSAPAESDDIEEVEAASIPPGKTSDPPQVGALYRQTMESIPATDDAPPAAPPAAPPVAAGQGAPVDELFTSSALFDEGLAELSDEIAPEQKSEGSIEPPPSSGTILDQLREDERRYRDSDRPPSSRRHIARKKPAEKRVATAAAPSPSQPSPASRDGGKGSGQILLASLVSFLLGIAATLMVQQITKPKPHESLAMTGTAKPSTTADNKPTPRPAPKETRVKGEPANDDTDIDNWAADAGQGQDEGKAPAFEERDLPAVADEDPPDKPEPRGEKPPDLEPDQPEPNEPEPKEPEPAKPEPKETEPEPESKEPGPFDKAVARAAVNGAAGAAAGCGDGSVKGRAPMAITFAPSGRVTQAVIAGYSPLAGTSVGSCVARAMRSARVPPFTGPPVTVRKTVTVR